MLVVLWLSTALFHSRKRLSNCLTQFGSFLSVFWNWKHFEAFLWPGANWLSQKTQLARRFSRDQLEFSTFQLIGSSGSKELDRSDWCALKSEINWTHRLPVVLEKIGRPKCRQLNRWSSFSNGEAQNGHRWPVVQSEIHFSQMAFEFSGPFLHCAVLRSCWNRWMLWVTDH